MVATVHSLATMAGVEALQEGGNAIDAAVAAGLFLGVVDSHNSGMGGGCFMLIRLASGEIVALDGRETSPAKAHRDMYVRNGHAIPELSRTGPLAVAIPGQVAAFHEAIERYGKLPWKRHCLAAADVAEKGFAVTKNYESRLSSVRADLSKFAGARSIFMKEDGSTWQAGEQLSQPDLGQTLRALAREGPAWFYKGPFAQRTAEWMKENGGLITAADFSGYKVKHREPLQTKYRGYTILGFPPPSSGGVHVGQILNILESFDLKAMGQGSADFIHVVAEAMKLAFADRAFWLGDPDFAKVPRGLIDKAYATSLAQRIDLKKATNVRGHSTPPNASEDVFEKHTTHYSTADAEGNWVACTATINTTYGSKVVIPTTGVVLNNEMDDFSAEPGMPNAFGLVGGEANAVAPGKRPLSSMSPTILLRGGKPVLSVGAAGGPTIITQTLLTIIQIVDFGESVQTALAQPRFHQQWLPNELRIERSVPETVREELARRGHTLKVVDSLGACQAVGKLKDGPAFEGSHDPRVSDGAAGGL
jgi:gamma-glutamyltranspeptidase/glutathione hydrolase